MGMLSRYGVMLSRPSKCATTCERCSAGSTLSSPANATSSALPIGSNRRRRQRLRQGPIDRSQATVQRQFAEAFEPLDRRERQCSEATRMPNAIGRSKHPPSLRRSAGAKLVMMRRLRSCYRKRSMRARASLIASTGESRRCR